MRRYFEVTVVGVMVFLATPVSVLAQGSFRYLGGFPDGVSGDTLPWGISADGSTVVGLSASRVIRWHNGVFTDLSASAPVGFGAVAAYGVSGDGSVVVGYGYPFGGNTEAFRWQNGVMTRLGDLQNGLPRSVAYGVSADGSVIVGYGFHAPIYDEAFRWENGVMVGLGDLPGGAFWSRGYAISADGKVIVGQSESDRGTEAFRWENGVMVGLGVLADDWGSAAYAVSADGRVVVGLNTPRSGSRTIFRWKDGTMVRLGPISYPGDWELARTLAVTANGGIVVGSGGGQNTSGALLWDEDRGARLLTDVLVNDFGLNVPSLILANGISADGLTIVGFGPGYSSGPGYIVQLPGDAPSDSDGDGVADPLDVCPNTVLGTTVDRVGCPPLTPGDFDRDGDVDLADFAIIQRCLSGADEPGDPACNSLP
jgi:probable HAF family extracellular repeat protein